MEDAQTYQIELRGALDEDDLNAGSPLQGSVKRVETASTRFTVRTDQSGLIGLLRHLHARGCVLVSVCIE